MPTLTSGLDNSILAGQRATGATAEVDVRDTGVIPEPTFKVASDNSSPNSRYAAYNDPSDNLANVKKHFIEIYHIPSKKNLFFKAFLTTFKDTFNTQYHKEDVFGRMDPIATFKRTGRIITLGWDVPASGINEAKENMAKANRMAQFLYPVYDREGGGATTMKSGPIFKVKMGNLIIQPGHAEVAGPAKEKGLPGIIEGFSYAPDLTHGVFDPGKTGEIYPKIMKVQIQFTVLHDTALGWVEDGQGNVIPRNESGHRTRFPYGGNNNAVDVAGRKVSQTPYVKEADWRAFLDLQTDLAIRRVRVRANQILQPLYDADQFLNF
mgnify:CR=1 FL=1|tara:strand:+ start:771 stop:1736 length:966 start_codon:yes stop_codon:yes gene_type:complete